jgi:hypothetical protein
MKGGGDILMNMFNTKLENCHYLPSLLANYKGI